MERERFAVINNFFFEISLTGKNGFPANLFFISDFRDLATNSLVVNTLAVSLVLQMIWIPIQHSE